MKTVNRFSHLARRSLLLAFFFFLFPIYSVKGAPRAGQSYQDPNAIAIREIRDTIGHLRYGIENHEAEIRTFDEKLKNLDLIIENLSDQVSDSGKQNKELLKSNSNSFESKIQALDAVSKGLVADLRQFKIHSNETTALLNEYRQKINELEKIVDQQNQNIGHLQAAMRSLMEALQGKPAEGTSSTANPGQTYKIKSGDSLEKIARAHGISIQALKMANNLINDKIVVGKTLIIPEK